MQYQMRLHPEPFEKIKAGAKTIEMRLNDEKRRVLKIGDEIEFENRADGEKILTKIVSLHYFNDFAELYAHFDKQAIGYGADETPNPDDMAQYYSSEDIQKFGTIAIEIRKI